MPRPQSIISVGANEELVSLREAVLRCAGLNVSSTLDPEEAFSRITSTSFRVMLLCYSLPAPVRERLAQHFRKCCPEGRIIAISDRQVEPSTLYADTFFYGIEGAEALIDNVRAELAKA